MSRVDDVAQVGSDRPEERSSDNVPGFEYLQRVSATAFRALQAHAEEVNGAWSEIRQGTYGFGHAVKTWAKLVENYSGVFTELMRGPSPFPQPAWLVIPRSRSQQSRRTFSVRIDRGIDKQTLLEATDFSVLGGGGPVRGLYSTAPAVSKGRVEIRLDEDAVQKLAAGDYLSFIFRKGVGETSPLVIVALHVTP